ncbi:MAG: ATP-binding cassette domain-containing protein [Candidatus Fibromonas sp.]|jgi:excinuclease ABC subunit A|nr:ATP-binding cassette domain-containing protein [Candidatus Fibromonas sp.]
MIEVIGARAHNLKNIDANFPVGGITVVCGPSGCGKSSLVLDVLHAESRRRYLETLGSAAITMLGGPRHVPVKAIHNLRPSIALECGDKIIAKKATVASLAEIAPMLRILFAECASPVCPECGAEMKSLTPQQMVEKLSAIETGTKFQILAPVNANNRTLDELAKIYLAQGFVKAIANGNSISLDFLSRNSENLIPQEFYLIMDRIIAKENQRTRLSEAIEAALKISENLILADLGDQKLFLSSIPRCEIHGCSAELLSERHFSPWSNIGQCPECKGIGLGCPVCNGFQLRDVALQSKWETFSWLSLHSKTLLELNKELPDYLKRVPERLKNTVLDIPIRISILCDLGIGHLSLGRLAETLSSGEAQRVRLAALCTGHLNGVLLCIDEPASGLHEKDVEKLWNALLQLKQRGNTLAIIEHHPRMINRADYVIEMGPGAGEEGGEIVESGELRVESYSSLPASNSQLSTLNSQLSIKISNARNNNLKNLNVEIPIGAMTVICGVSGSGKSSLLWGVIEPLVSRAINKKAKKTPVECGILKRLHGIDSILAARTGRAFAQKRSTIATSIDAMQIFKNLFANSHESKIRGYSTVKFGTDKPGGRCEICKGNGSLFDPSGYEESLCPICLGKRYRDEILEIRYKLMSIADVLDLSVSKAMEIFADFESLIPKLKPLADTGLHYLRLGQPTTHLSGGELQRLRLAQDLAKAKLPRTLYLFDEPARGLSLKDTTLLLNLLKGLTQKGHTVVAIEHNEMFRSHANHILELGPGAGEDGGYIVNTK